MLDKVYDIRYNVSTSIISDCKISQISIEFVFWVALPPKKHLLDEQSESARRGELPKSKILASGDNARIPAKRGITCKTQFYKCLLFSCNSKKFFESVIKPGFCDRGRMLCRKIGK